jgi:hypothetical protein
MRARAASARAQRARQNKSTSPPRIFRRGRAAAFFCIMHRGKLLQHNSIGLQCNKKVPEYRYPLYHCVHGYCIKKVIFEYSFYYTQEKLFLKHTTRTSHARVTDKKNPPALQGYYLSVLKINRSKCARGLDPFWTENLPNIAAARSVAASRGARRSGITAPRCHISLPAAPLKQLAGPYRACMRFESHAASHACRVDPDRVLGKGALFMIFRLEVVPEQTVRRYFLQVKKLTFKRAPRSHMPFCSTVYLAGFFYH